WCSCEATLLACTARYQPIRSMSAKPRASLRSEFVGRIDKAAWACRASMHTTGSPAEVNTLKQPERGRAGLESDPHHPRRFASDQCNQCRRFGCSFAFEDDSSIAIDDAYADFLQRHVQRDILLHGGISESSVPGLIIVSPASGKCAPRLPQVWKRSVW